MEPISGVCERLGRVGPSGGGVCWRASLAGLEPEVVLARSWPRRRRVMPCPAAKWDGGRNGTADNRERGATDEYSFLQKNTDEYNFCLLKRFKKPFCLRARVPGTIWASSAARRIWIPQKKTPVSRLSHRRLEANRGESCCSLLSKGRCPR